MSPGLTSTGAEPAEVSGAPSVSARCPGVGGPEQRWCIFALSWATSATDLRLGPCAQPGAVRALCQWGSSSESHTDSDVWTLPLSGSDSSDWLVECPGMPPVGLCTTSDYDEGGLGGGTAGLDMRSMCRTAASGRLQ